LIIVMVIVTSWGFASSHSSLCLSDWCTIFHWLNCHGLLIIELKTSRDWEKSFSCILK
jgi:hypothetical protein